MRCPYKYCFYVTENALQKIKKPQNFAGKKTSRLKIKSQHLQEFIDYKSQIV